MFMKDKKEKIISALFLEECKKRNLSSTEFQNASEFFKEYQIPFIPTYSPASLKVFEKVEYHIYFQENKLAKELLTVFYNDKNFYYSYNYPECLLAKYAIEILDHKGNQQNEEQWNSLYELLDDSKLISFFYFFFGYFYVQNNLSRKAFNIFKKGYDKSVLFDTIYMQTLYLFHIAIQNDIEHHLFEALKYYKKVNQQFSFDNNHLRFNGCTLNITTVYSKLQLRNLSIECYKKILNSANRFADTHLKNLVFLNLAFDYLADKQYSNTIYYVNEGLKLPGVNSFDHYYLAEYYYMLCWAYCGLNDMPKAKQAFDKGKKYFPNDVFITNVYRLLEFFIQKDINSKNFENCLLELYQCIDINNSENEKKLILEEMCAYYKRIHDYEKVYKYNEEILSILELADQAEEDFDEII